MLEIAHEEVAREQQARDCEEPGMKNSSKRRRPAPAPESRRRGGEVPFDRNPSDAAQASSSRAASVSTGSTKRHRIGKGLAALSSAAILSVYAVGYVRTQAAERQVAGTGNVTAAAVGTAGSGGPTSAVGTAGSGGPSSAVATQSPTAAAYRDGTYVGTGSSRHGNIEATVTIANGKIVSTVISQCLTRYPCSYISKLPAQVVTRQSAKVNLVSGATDSSNAFVKAVAAALAYAK
jgi:uncharacterized protein with FMN-binding domain